MSDISDTLCIHKDIERTIRYVTQTFGISYEQQAPIAYCKTCPGAKSDCFYYYRLKDIKRNEDDKI